MSFRKRRLSKLHRVMLVDMLETPAPRELEINLRETMRRQAHVRLAREETITSQRPVLRQDKNTGKSYTEILPVLRRAQFWELTRAGQNVAKQLKVISDRERAARLARNAGIADEFPPGTRVAIVHTGDGGRVYRIDDLPEGSEGLVTARGYVTGTEWENGHPNVQVQVDEATEVDEVPTSSSAPA